MNDSISIIIPTYNEKDNIIPMIEELKKTFEQYTLDIIVVDDSSPDGTAQLVKDKYQNDKTVLLIIRDKKEGLGEALKTGYASAQGNIIASIDCDFSFEPEVLKNMTEMLHTYDLVVASRYEPGGKYEQKTARTKIQSLISRNGNKLIRFIFPKATLSDFTTNCRCFKRNVWYDEVSSKVKEKGNMFLVEMIILASKKNKKMKSYPVIFKNRVHGKSKTRMINEIFRFLIKVVQWKIE